ncbi:Wadjet anti-phage system protein JetD domain-containing protein [Endozoicomonas numazuensis]|uniref:Wadjet anti-phage system protein JetD domain-containing protein n=1 Tax=Endozoicomonas numazuensis TaxID=1137799 RepID=UPI000691294C|nr:Wadjet anti-phage system protein JetD domain-containing protein [Endozoicomonas numazuensis]
MFSEEDKVRVLDWFIKKRTETNASSAPNMIKKALGIESLLVIEAILKALAEEDKIISSQNDVRFGKLSCLVTPTEPLTERYWYEVLSHSPDGAALAPCHGVLSDWSKENMQTLFEGLLALKSDLPDAYQMTAFEASARYLLGSSKLLEALGKRNLQLFGIDPDLFRKPISYVVTAGPEHPEQVLLIENPQSFEACIELGLHERIGLVSTFGYGLGWLQVIENRKSVVGISRGGAEQDLLTLLDHPKLYFWGDLDHEGIKIYRAIRQQYPQCRLSHLYLPMIEKVETGFHHPYVKAVGKEGQKNAGDSRYANGLDQESLENSVIKAYFLGGIEDQQWMKLPDNV